MDIRSDDLITVKVREGTPPESVLVFVSRKRHEIAEGRVTPIDEIQLQLGVDYVVESSSAA